MSDVVAQETTTKVVVSEASHRTVRVRAAAERTVVVKSEKPSLRVTESPRAAVLVTTGTAQKPKVLTKTSRTLLRVFNGPTVNVTGGGTVQEEIPWRMERGSRGQTKRYIYVGFSSAPNFGDENEGAAEWKIYRYDSITDTSSFADGDQLFDNVWDTGTNPPTYETLMYP